jgi:hypothetical protein
VLAIIAIVAPTSVGATLFVLGYCFLSRRARKKYNAIQEGGVKMQLLYN